MGFLFLLDYLETSKPGSGPLERRLAPRFPSMTAALKADACASCSSASLSPNEPRYLQPCNVALMPLMRHALIAFSPRGGSVCLVQGITFWNGSLVVEVGLVLTGANILWSVEIL